MTSLRAATATDTGRVRSKNEDFVFASGELVAVADGMGGHASGEVAAHTAIDTLASSFTPATGSPGLVEAAHQANRAILAQAESDAHLRGMGTTLTAAAIVADQSGEVLAVVNVGDSRAYLYQNRELSQITADHSLVEELVRAGELTTAEAAVHPHRNILTRALGIDDPIEVDTFFVAPTADTRLLLCSDGLTNECSDEEIARILGEYHDPAQAAEALVRRALDHGGNDNITVVVADVIGTTMRDERSGPTTAARPTVVAAEPTPEPVVRQAARPPRAKREHLVTFRVVLFVLVFVAVLGGAAGFVDWYAEATYYVGISDHHVAVFEGRPGGILWFHPTLIEQTSIATSQVLPTNLPLLRAGLLESSYGAAKRTADQLGSERSLLGISTGSGTKHA